VRADRAGADLPFGFGGALRIVALPLLAALCSLASLGWLGQPLTLFSLFGLLLVTAISVDYAILMREQHRRRRREPAGHPAGGADHLAVVRPAGRCPARRR
jgi:multidrug efflux pump subunit AcrB